MPSDSKKKRDAKKKEAAKANPPNGTKAPSNGLSGRYEIEGNRELTVEGIRHFFFNLLFSFNI